MIASISSSPLLGLPDDALDTLLVCCDIKSVGRIGITCRQLTTFVSKQSNANRMHCKFHLCHFLKVPLEEYDNVETPSLSLLPAAFHNNNFRSLLQKAIENPSRSSASLPSRRLASCEDRISCPAWKSNRAIVHDTIGWNKYKLLMGIDGENRCAICTRHPIPKHPTTVVLKRRRNNNKHVKPVDNIGTSSSSRGARRTSRKIIDIRISSIFYFEIKLLGGDNKKQQPPSSCVAIGLCRKSSGTKGCQPGWRCDGLGYHSDDGQIYHGRSTSGHAYGPKFNNDGNGGENIVGCGVHIPSGSVFFTKNGFFIGTAFLISNIGCDDRLVPVIGLDTQNSSVIVNFGSDTEFLFDIELAEQLYQNDHLTPSLTTRITKKQRHGQTEEKNSGTADVDNERQQINNALQHLQCKYTESSWYHPWNNFNAWTRRISIEKHIGFFYDSADSSYGSEESDSLSLDDSSLAVSNSVHYYSLPSSFDSDDNSSHINSCNGGGSIDSDNNGSSSSEEDDGSINYFV